MRHSDEEPQNHSENDTEVIEPKFWAFVDNENFPGFFRNRDLDVFDRLYLFIGNNQKGLSVELVLRLQSMSSRVRFILVEETGRNNLDMYLIFYLGIAHEEADDNTRFVIFSSDSDFDNIINHCNTRLGRPCLRIMDDANNTAQHRLKHDPQDAAQIEVLPYQKVLENIYKIHHTNPNSLPQKKSTLVNFIGSIIRPYANGQTADDFFQQMIEEKKIKVDAYNKVIYSLNAPPPPLQSEYIDSESHPDDYAI